MSLAHYHRTLIIMLLGMAAPAVFAEAKSYPDGHGGEVHFPLGDVSFADTVVRYQAGDPAPVADSRDPARALGMPNVGATEAEDFVTLGCAGSLVLRFDDNALVDVPGPDLHVFEIGPDTEPTGLSVSRDGEQWLRVGRISGGQAAIDLAPYATDGQPFSHVRLVDLKKRCRGDTPGADIDAVGAIGSAQRLVLDSAVLFDSGTHVLKPAAAEAINTALADIDDPATTSVRVAGHTDSVGSDADNRELSENRAQAVVDYLIDTAGFTAERVTRDAFGETRPIADNDTAAGRAKNRRVELTVRSSSPAATDTVPAIEILGIWASGNKGLIEMRRIDGVFEGDYESDGGRLRGQFVSETVFEGFWIEDNSRRSCDRVKAGSDHWGPVRIEFDTPARDRFTSQWRYCGENEWRGPWVSAERLL